MRATAFSPANIAFIKYWGRLNHKLFLPVSTSSSMNLSGCNATTTVDFDPKYRKDEISIIGADGKEMQVTTEGGEKNVLLFKTLDRIRHLAGINTKALVKSKLNFPLGAGIASSAAGFSAFVAAACVASGRSDIFEDKLELSREIRLAGSPSAARSVLDGFVELLTGRKHSNGYARQIAGEKHWDLVDTVAVLTPEQKKVSSSEGHILAASSPFFIARKKYLKGKDGLVRKAILGKDFKALAELSEADSINMHAIMMTSKPAIYYLSSGSMDIINEVISWRNNEKMDVFFTFDAGPNAHVVSTSKYAPEIKKRLDGNKYVDFTIANKPAKGTSIISGHLFT